MRVVTITHEKYYEIHDELIRTSENIPYQNTYLFERHLRCSPTLSVERIEERALVDLTFENEQDYLWFILRFS